MSNNILSILKNNIREHKLQFTIFTLIWFVFVLYFSYIILKDAGWIFFDNNAFWARTAIGEPFRPIDFIWPSALRFFPLTYMDFNFLLLFFETPSALVHYAWVTITFVFFAFFFMYLLLAIEQDNRFNYSILLLPIFFISIFFTADIVVIFLNVIFPERIMLLTLTIFLLLYYKAIKSDNLITYLFAVPFAVVATYHKEPMFGALLVIAMFNFLFHYKKITFNHKIFNLCLIINAIVYSILFYILVYSQNAGGSYASGRDLGGLFGAIEAIIFNQEILIVGYIFGIIRAYFLIFTKEQQKHLFFDATLYAGLAYSFAFVILEMHELRYQPPAVLFLYPSFLYWTLKSYIKIRILPLFLAVFIVLIPIKYYDAFKTNVMWYQSERSLWHEHMTRLVELRKQGYKFVMIEEEVINPENGFNHGTDVHKGYLSHALNYFFPEYKLNDSFGFTETLDANYTFVDKLNTDFNYDKIVVFYPLQNNLEGGMNSTTENILQKHFHSPEVISYSIQVYYPFSVDVLTEKINKLEEINFETTVSGQNFDTHFLYAGGWHLQEGNGRWSNNENVNLIMKVDPKTRGIKLSDLWMFIPPNGSLDIAISMNDIEISSYSFSQPVAEIDIPFPQATIENLENDNIISIKLNMPNVQSPMELGISPDSRKLGIYLNKIVTYGDLANNLPKTPINSPISSHDFDTFMVHKGFSGQEDWGRWTDGANVNFTMKVDPATNGIKLLIGHIFIPPNTSCDLTVIINGVEAFSHSYSNHTSEINIPLPQEVKETLEEDNIIYVELLMPNVKSPKELGMNNDARKLGLGLTAITTY